MKHLKMIVFILLTFLSIAPACAEGFAAGTLVKTSNGYTAIENIKIGDQVVCLNAQQEFVDGTIMHVAKKSINQYLRISIAQKYLCVACDQQFYDESNDSWITAESLKHGDILSGQVIEVELINEKTDVYLLSIAQYHNFLVTKTNICAHNFFPLVLGFSVAFGGGLELAGFSMGLAGLGGFLGYQWHKKNKQKHNLTMSQISFDKSCQSDDIYNLNDAQAPGLPTEKDGFYPPKKWDGKKKRNPNGGGFGWADEKGHIWVPTGPKAHRGPHWDVQDPKTGRHRNVLPGGRVC